MCYYLSQLNREGLLLHPHHNWFISLALTSVEVGVGEHLFYYFFTFYLKNIARIANAVTITPYSRVTM